MNNKNLRIFAVLFIGLFFLSACVQQGSSPTSTPTPTRTDEPGVAQPVEGTVSPTLTPMDTNEPFATQIDEPTVVPAKPQPRVGLEGTDPTTVDLESGTPTLVEFFAFW